MCMNDLLTNPTLRTIALGTATLGFISGMLGSFAVLRKQSLVGDAISHAALPGIMLAFILTGSKGSLILMLGAGIAGWLGTLAVMGIVRGSPIKYDSALGLVLSVFFGIGLLFYSYIQSHEFDGKAGLFFFLFGQAATLIHDDIVRMGVLGGVALLLMAAFWKEFKLLCFDPDFGASLGWPMRLLDVILTTLLVIATVIGLETVGVVLMSAMLVAPAAAARQWTDRLGVLVLLAGVFGAMAGVAGALASYELNLPTGPAVVLVLSGLVMVSLLFAPNRGLAWDGLRHLRNRRLLQLDAVLSNLHALEAQHASPGHGHALPVLEAMSPAPEGVRRSLQQLLSSGLVCRTADNKWALTPAGRAKLDRV
jgi:manganese/zinc/iron transport system permease protein